MHVAVKKYAAAAAGMTGRLVHHHPAAGFGGGDRGGETGKAGADDVKCSGHGGITPSGRGGCRR